MSIQEKKVINNLKTAKGQLEAIIKMVEEDRYCVVISCTKRVGVRYDIKGTYRNS